MDEETKTDAEVSGEPTEVAPEEETTEANDDKVEG